MRMIRTSYFVCNSVTPRCGANPALAQTAAVQTSIAPAGPCRRDVQAARAASPADSARGFRPRIPPADSARAFRPCIPPVHSARAFRPCIPPAHPARASRPRIPPAHPARASRLRIPLVHPARASRPRIPPAHPARTTRPRNGRWRAGNPCEGRRQAPKCRARTPSARLKRFTHECALGRARAPCMQPVRVLHARTRSMRSQP